MFTCAQQRLNQKAEGSKQGQNSPCLPAAYYLLPTPRLSSVSPCLRGEPFLMKVFRVEIYVQAKEIVYSQHVTTGWEGKLR